MQVIANVTEPQKVNITINATMRLDEWQRVVAKLQAGDFDYPGNDFAGQIKDAIEQVTDRFIANPLIGENHA